MLRSERFFFICATLVAASVFTTTACKCRLEHEQIAYCRGNNALAFSVDEKTEVNLVDGQIVETYTGNSFAEPINRYHVSHVTVYQVEQGVTLSNISYVYSRVSGAACGRHLDTVTRYIAIGGSVINGNYFINSCMNVVDQNNLGILQQFMALLNLQRLYKRGCERCRVTECVDGEGGECVTEQAEDICRVSALDPFRQPFQSACVKNYLDKCYWIDLSAHISK